LDLRVAPVSVQSQVVAKLRGAIFPRVFSPGEKLSEPGLCRDLGGSRTSIREALRSLAGEKLVTIVPNKGRSASFGRTADIVGSVAQPLSAGTTFGRLNGYTVAYRARRSYRGAAGDIRRGFGSHNRAAKVGDPDAKEVKRADQPQ
jgi:DNA-binding transcriptional MocR family regulator